MVSKHLTQNCLHISDPDAIDRLHALFTTTEKLEISKSKYMKSEEEVMKFLMSGDNIYKPIFLHKALKYDPVKHKNLLTGRLIEEKLDGVGSQVVINGLDIQIYAMTKAAVSGEFSNFTDKLPHIVDELRLASLDNGIYQGELIANHFKDNNDNFGFVTGTLHADNALDRQVENKIKLVLYEVPSSIEPYYKRHEYLDTVFNINAFPYPLKYVSVNPIIGINDENDVVLEQRFQEIIDRAGEGVVLYDKNCLYKHSDKTCQRNKGLIKIKAADEKEVLCVEKIEGKGKFQGSLGAIICKDNEGRTFHCGSFSIDDSQRQYIYDNVETPFVCEITYYRITDSSYKLPRLTRYRPDKDMDSWNRSG